MDLVFINDLSSLKPVVKGVTIPRPQEFSPYYHPLLLECRT